MGKMTGNLEPSGTVELYICCPQKPPTAPDHTHLEMRSGVSTNIYRVRTLVQKQQQKKTPPGRIKNEIPCCEHPGTDASAATLQASAHLFAHAHCAKIRVDTRPTPPSSSSSSSHTLITCTITSPSSNNQITGGGKLVKAEGENDDLE